MWKGAFYSFLNCIKCLKQLSNNWCAPILQNTDGFFNTINEFIFFPMGWKHTVFYNIKSNFGQLIVKLLLYVYWPWFLLQRYILFFHFHAIQCKNIFCWKNSIKILILSNKAQTANGKFWASGELLNLHVLSCYMRNEWDVFHT